MNRNFYGILQCLLYLSGKRLFESEKPDPDLKKMIEKKIREGFFRVLQLPSFSGFFTI